MTTKKKKIGSKKTVSAKKYSKKNTSKKMIVASGQHCFWVNNGPILRNLKELGESFKKMSDAQFAYHVNKKRNDFANWVQYVLLDTACATKLKECKTRTSAVTCVANA